MSDPTGRGGPTGPNLGGARWCEEHERYECTKNRTKREGRCHQAAVAGTSACPHHGGQSLEVLKAQGQARITAFSALGGVPSIHPGEAVLASLHMSWLRVHLYARLLEEQIAAAREEAELRGESFTDGAADVQPSAEGLAGLIGHTFAADKMAGIFASGEAVRALVTLEAQERDRAVRYAKVAHDMGIAEREVKLAEQQGQLLAMVINNVLGDLSLTAEQQALVPTVVQARLMEATQLEVTGGAA